MRRGGWSVLAAAVLVLGGAVPAAAATPEVRPGQLVAWSSPGTERCFVAGASFEPIDDTCWFPVDLLTPAGSLEVARRRDGQRETAHVRVGAYPYPEQRLTVDPGHVDLSPEDAARSARESARVAELWDLETERRFTLPLSPPLADLPEGGRFGARRVFNGEPRSPHTGADYAAPKGTKVLAVAPGRVVLAADHFFSGKSVFLDHGDGLITMYFHLSEIAVAEGGTVEAGESLGTVGATGRATGPHLHFGARWRGARIDPAVLLAPQRSARLPAAGR